MRISRTRLKEYKTWVSMRQRCNNPRSSYYHCYGGRGIKVCERWDNSFDAFLEDMGTKPSNNYSIERINVDGNYEPINCKWATLHEQAANKRNTSERVGVKFDKSKNKWRARFKYGGVSLLDREFITYQEALAERVKFENKYLNRNTE